MLYEFLTAPWLFELAAFGDLPYADLILGSPNDRSRYVQSPLYFTLSNQSEMSDMSECGIYDYAYVEL